MVPIVHLAAEESFLLDRMERDAPARGFLEPAAVPPLIDLAADGGAHGDAHVIVTFRVDSAITVARHHLGGQPVNVLAAPAPGLAEATDLGSVAEIGRRLAGAVRAREFSRVVMVGLSAASFTAAEAARALSATTMVRLGLVDPPSPDTVLADVAEALFAPHMQRPDPGGSALLPELLAWRGRAYQTLPQRLQACRELLSAHRAELHAFMSTILPSLGSVDAGLVSQAKSDWMSHLILAEGYPGTPYGGPARCLLGAQNAAARPFVERLVPQGSIRSAAEDHSSLISRSAHLPFALWLDGSC
jgi:hypothetical protein